MKYIVVLILFFSLWCSKSNAQEISLPSLIDSSITGFHQGANFQGLIVFLKNGADDLEKINPSAFSISMMQGASVQQAKEQLYILQAASQYQGYVISQTEVADTTVKGHPAFYSTYTETKASENYVNRVFNGFVVVDGNIYFFTSGDLDNGLYAEKFRQTFFALKL